MLRCYGIVIVLAVALTSAPVHADRVARPPGRLVPGRVSPGPVPGRVRPRQPPSHAPLARPAMREVRTAMRHLGPEVQSCVDRHGSPPGSGTQRRLRVRVWLLPSGRWTLEVPELGVRNDRSAPTAVRRPLMRLYACLNILIARRVGRHSRAYRGTRRQKVERAFRVSVPGPPPTAAVLSRRVRTRRSQLVACVPGGTLRAPNAELVVRANLGTDGTLTLRGLAVPPTVSFDHAARCVGYELAQFERMRSTSERAFEVVIRFHLPTESADTRRAELSEL